MRYKKCKSVAALNSTHHFTHHWVMSVHPRKLSRQFATESTMIWIKSDAYHIFNWLVIWIGTQSCNCLIVTAKEEEKHNKHDFFSADVSILERVWTSAWLTIALRFFFRKCYMEREPTTNHDVHDYLCLSCSCGNTNWLYIYSPAWIDFCCARISMVDRAALATSFYLSISSVQSRHPHFLCANRAISVLHIILPEPNKRQMPIFRINSKIIKQ